MKGKSNRRLTFIFYFNNKLARALSQNPLYFLCCVDVLLLLLSVSLPTPIFFIFFLKTANSKSAILRNGSILHSLFFILKVHFANVPKMLLKNCIIVILIEFCLSGCSHFLGSK